MAKIGARGDVAAIKLRQPNGGLVVVTRKGRLLAQPFKGAGYALVDARYGSSWAPDWMTSATTRESVTRYLLKWRYPGAEVIA